MPSKNGYIAAGIMTAGLLTAGGVSMASAASSTTDNAQGYGYSVGDEGRSGQEGPGRAGTQGPGKGHRPMGTKVTGDEATKVGDAVKAKDSSVTIDGVMKDPKGGYHVMTTSNGKHVLYRVSKDLKTVTKDTAPGREGHRGRHLGTPVTKSVGDQVTAAVRAKDSSVTVKHVFKRADGSYEAFGTKDGKPVAFTVNKDLKTVTEQKMPQRGEGPRDGAGRPGKGTPAPAPSGSASAPA